MKKWICLFVFFAFLQASAQYSYTYTDPCTLQSKSVFVPAGGGVVVNYFDNHNIFTANDFSSGAFDTWIAQVAQSNSNSPCQSVTTTIVNTVSTAVVSNTVSIVTNVVSISSLAQTMASVMTSTTGGALTSTAESISNSNTGGSSDSSNENNSNESTTGNNTGGSSANVNSNQGSQQSQGNSNSVQGSGTNSSNQGGTTPKTDTKTTGVASSGSKQTPTGNQQTSTPVTQNQQTTTPAAQGTTSGASGNTANSVSNSIDGGSSDNSSNPTTSESSETKEGKSGGGSNLANSLSNAADGGGSDSSSSSGGGGGGSSKKESSAKASTGSLIASGDMVVIANADREQPNQYKFVGSITHANTRGTRIKGILFNYTTGVNNFNVTLYKSYINKSRKLNTVVANSTMVNTAKDIFNTTTALESYKVNKKVTGMFGLNFTAGRLGERNFYNLSAVVGGHAPIQVTKTVSTSILVLGIYSPFTQFYEGQWWSAGVLVVPFNSWDFKITKTFKFNISATAVYSYGESFLNYQVLTGGKLNF